MPATAFRTLADVSASSARGTTGGSAASAPHRASTRRCAGRWRSARIPRGGAPPCRGPPLQRECGGVERGKPWIVNKYPPRGLSRALLHKFRALLLILEHDTLRSAQSPYSTYQKPLKRLQSPDPESRAPEDYHSSHAGHPLAELRNQARRRCDQREQEATDGLPNHQTPFVPHLCAMNLRNQSNTMKYCS